MGSQLRRRGKKKKNEFKAKHKWQNATFAEDVVRSHRGANKAKWADNATERQIIRFPFVGDEPLKSVGRQLSV